MVYHSPKTDSGAVVFSAYISTAWESPRGALRGL